MVAFICNSAEDNGCFWNLVFLPVLCAKFKRLELINATVFLSFNFDIVSN